MPVEIKKPTKGASVRVGPYTITVDWPDLVVHSDAPVLQSTFFKVLRAGEIDCRLRVDHEPTEKLGLVLDEPAIFFPEALEGDTVWCGCREKVDRKAATRPTTQEVRFASGTYKHVELKDIAAISFPFHLPVEEPFEVTSPPLK